MTKNCLLLTTVVAWLIRSRVQKVSELHAKGLCSRRQAIYHMVDYWSLTNVSKLLHFHDYVHAAAAADDAERRQIQSVVACCCHNCGQKYITQMIVRNMTMI